MMDEPCHTFERGATTGAERNWRGVLARVVSIAGIADGARHGDRTAPAPGTTRTTAMVDAAAPRVSAISDLPAGVRVISRIDLSDAPRAQIDLGRFLDCLLAAPPDAETYFRLLEQVRAPIAAVAGELAKHYLNKPLPLADADERTFQRVVGLWLKTARAYAQCADDAAARPDDTGRTRRLATILQRCIDHTGQAIVEHQRARREYPWGLWLALHGYYSDAEQRGAAALSIPDGAAASGRRTSCAAAYLGFLLCDMAGAYSLSLRQQALVRRWATLWSPLLGVHRVEPQDAPPQVLDLMQDGGLRHLSSDDLRRIDTSRLALHLSQTRRQLSRKVPPAQLGLGEDCRSGQCKRLLDRLSDRWSQTRTPRKFRRHDGCGSARLCTGLAEIHDYISGQAFARQACGIDHWNIVNQSANGFCLTRGSAGKKMVHAQLVALCPNDGQRFLLAQLVWLRQSMSGGLIAGFRVLPGMPVAAATRPAGGDSGGDGILQRAFLLPAVPPVGSEASLVLPVGCYQHGRVIDLFADGQQPVRLQRVLDSGADFARVSFAAA